MTDAGRGWQGIRPRGGLAALGHPGFRRYFVAMLVRGVATWMQLVSIPWFAVQLDADPAALGLITGFMFLPTLAFSALGGVVADRVDRGHLVTATQALAVAQSAGLAGLVLVGATLPLVAVFALWFGIITALELPVRMAFAAEFVPERDRVSAMSLHATAWNTTRFVGPGLAGLLLATAGSGATFAASCLLSAIVLVALLRIDRYRRPGMRGTPEVVSVREALAQGLAHVVANEGIRRAVLFSSLSGMLGIQAFQTLAPLFVADHLRSGGGAYGTFMACWGGGALAGAWAGTVGAHATHHSRLTSGSLGLGAALVGVALTAAPITFVLAGVLGFAQILLVQTAMLVVLDSTSDGLRGRVMGLYVTAFQGTAPLGSVMAGVAAQLLGVQLAMAASGVLLVCLIGVSALALRLTGRTARDPAPATDP